LLSGISRALILGFVACASAGALLARPFVAWFLDARYSAAGGIVPWIIGGYLMHAFFTLFQLAIMQAKKTSYLPWLTAIAFVLNIALNFALVPPYGIAGAAWATLAAYAVEAAAVFALAQRVFRLDYRALEMIVALAVFCAALAATQMQGKVTNSAPAWMTAFAVAAVGTIAATKITSSLRELS
jgi:O-antigen/teichoic acid export membrane protein